MKMGKRTHNSVESKDIVSLALQSKNEEGELKFDITQKNFCPSSVRPSIHTSVTLRLPLLESRLDSETEWTGELLLKTNLLKEQN